MKLFKITCFCLLLFCSKAAISSAYQGKVINVFAYSGKVFVTVANGAFDGPVSCTTTTTNMVLWIDPTTAYGKTLVSIALAAKTTGGLVWAGGDNACITGPGAVASEQMVMIDFKG